MYKNCNKSFLISLNDYNNKNNNNNNNNISSHTCYNCIEQYIPINNIIQILIMHVMLTI